MRSRHKHSAPLKRFSLVGRNGETGVLAKSETGKRGDGLEPKRGNGETGKRGKHTMKPGWKMRWYERDALNLLLQSSFNMRTLGGRRAAAADGTCVKRAVIKSPHPGCGAEPREENFGIWGCKKHEFQAKNASQSATPAPTLPYTPTQHMTHNPLHPQPLK